jgi:PLD-like domain/DnaJ domain
MGVSRTLFNLQSGQPMELKAHFSDIHKVIIDHLRTAQSEIVAAVAWFTDRDIFDVLCKKAGAGVKVSIAVIGDDINKGPGGLNFHRLDAVGGQVTFLPAGSRDTPIMHHKFCVIDRSTVITGSYNWSRKARSNDENVTVVTDSTDFASKYLDTFHNLLQRTALGAAPVAVDADAVRRRLEMVRNLILLGEQEDVPTHLRKLRPVAEALELTRIITALDNGEYKTALELIDAYLRKATALVVSGLADIPRLRFVLETLELRLESLSDEKADLERRLITFNRRHDEALGDLIQNVLRARAELARLIAADLKNGEEHQKAEAAARDAEATYQDYSTHHEELQRTPPLPKLDEEIERELKAVYRKACSLCHPDKFQENQKEAAHRAFTELQEAYKSNDFARVKEIHGALKAGGLPDTRSTTLSEVDTLKAAIAELETAIKTMVAELKALQISTGVKLMETVGSTETDWQRFFEQQYEALENELAKIVSKILAAQTEEQAYHD